PMPSASRYTIHIWMLPVSTSVASTTMHAALTARAPRSTRRGDMRSTTAPPTSMNAARGKAITASTMPSAAGSPVSFNTSHGNATSVNWSPNAEIELPPNSRLKSRLAKRDLRAGAGAAGEAVFMVVPARMPLRSLTSQRHSHRPTRAGLFRRREQFRVADLDRLAHRQGLHACLLRLTVEIEHGFVE